MSFFFPTVLLMSTLIRLTEISFRSAFGKNPYIRQYAEDIREYPEHCQFSHVSRCFKAVLINQTIKDYGGFVIWLDPRDANGKTQCAKKKLDRIRERLLR